MESANRQSQINNSHGAPVNKYQKVFGVGPVGIFISFMVLILLLILKRIFGPAEISDWSLPIRTIGWAMIGIWICWHAWAIKTIRSWWYNDRLCTTGPFYYVRHPMYAGTALLAFPGIALLFNSWIILPWPVLMYPVVSVLVRKEELMMTEVFGQQYQEYAARTGRLIPRFH